MAAIRILVVDDDPNVVNALKMFFRHRGDVWRTAANGREALEVLAQEDFDVLLSDLAMPELGGLELVKTARSLRPEMGCVLMSGLGTRGDVIAALKIGVVDFVDKPFEDLAALTFVVERAAEWSRLRRERAAMLENLQSQNVMLESSLARLRHAYDRLVQQEETLEADLRQAQHVQRMLLPRAFPQLDGTELFGFFGPCEGLGGDFFGALPLGEGRVAVYLADVMGHGVQAAMITVILRELMNARRKADPKVASFGSPGGTLTFLNDALREEAFDPPILVSMIYAVIDTRTGRVTIASAGHPKPIHVRAGQGASFVSVAGPVLATTPAAEFTPVEIMLEPGDFVLLYSDGLSDAQNPQGKGFSADRLRDVTARLTDRSAEEIGHGVETTVLKHLAGNPAADDMSFVVINRATVEREAAKPAAPSVRIVLPQEIRRARLASTGGISAGWNRTVCVIHLEGTCTWQLAATLRGVIEKAISDHARTISLDLVDCQGMDSTILGLIYQCADSIVLHRPPKAVLAQLREIGIVDRLHIEADPPPATDLQMPLPRGEAPGTSSGLIRSAHEALMQVSDENRVRFKGVIEALAVPHESHS